ncbi:MAG: hypothetical protein WBH14_08800, partial [Albidovulum sp.]
CEMSSSDAIIIFGAANALFLAVSVDHSAAFLVLRRFRAATCRDAALVPKASPEKLGRHLGLRALRTKPSSI